MGGDCQHMLAVAARKLDDLWIHDAWGCVEARLMKVRSTRLFRQVTFHDYL
jgi:hypothetical protein